MATEPKATVRMKYAGHFIGRDKIVALPVPLIARSQQLEESLVFTRTSDKQGPAYCEVPMKWVGALVEVGGHFKIEGAVTPELQGKIAEGKALCDAEMKKFVLENELVQA